MIASPHRYFMLHKPAGVLSQFISDSPKATLLGSIGFTFPEGTHAIGRLDKDTEGLLLLTTDKRITGLLFNTPKKHIRTYLVMVKNVMSEETFQHIQEGITIRLKDQEYYKAIPADVQRIENPLEYYAFATNELCQYAHTWLLLTLTEGKYRQVRKMMMAARHRCLRLIRLSIENMTLAGTLPGEVKEFSEEEFFELLCLGNTR
jgi:23S rRNA pseudouridine2457 synthase